MPALPLLALNAIAMLAVALFFALSGSLAPQAYAHIAFALGILPLILAAIAYFVPVLTRGSGAPAKLQIVPLLAWCGGALIVAGFVGAIRLTAASHGAFLLAGTAAAIMLAWARYRAKAALGAPHPALAWYLAALLCLLLALLTVPAMALWPAQRAALRLFHLHANLLGFVGLTAIGTLQVLVPTAIGQPDPQASQRLRKDLKFALGGTLLIAGGAAWFAPLALLGAGLYVIAPLRMALHWTSNWRERFVAVHGAAPSLALATCGLFGLLGAGIGHGLGWLDGRAAIGGFVIAFLLPLVSGAASQLLPVWLRPGPQSEWHARLRTALGWLGGVRALLMVSGGLVLSLGGTSGQWLALGGIVLLALALARALLTCRRST